MLYLVRGLSVPPIPLCVWVLCCSSSCVTCVLWDCSRCCSWAPVWVPLCSCFLWLPTLRAELLQGEVLWHTLLFLHLCRNSSCVTALSISLTLDVPPPQSFSCSSVHTFVLLSSWCSGNPTLCSTAAASVCAGSDQTWLRGGQGHPWCPLGVRALCWELQLWLGSTRGVFCAPWAVPAKPQDSLGLWSCRGKLCWSWAGFGREPQVRGEIPKASLWGLCVRKLLQPLLHHNPLACTSRALTQGCEPLPCAAQCPELFWWDWAHPSVWGQSSAHWRGSLFIISYFISVKLYDLHEILWFTALPIWSITTAYNNLCTDMPLRTFLIVKIVFKINVKLI